MNCLKKVVMVSLCALLILELKGQTHPGIMFTRERIAALREGVATYPLLQKSYETVKRKADQALLDPVNVPLPKDGGGGPTHEQHKKNYIDILNCGIVYQLSGEKKYADHVRDILLDYAGKYRKWPLHPKRRADNQAGRIFWQSLNDFVWQVYTIQGYDMVYDALTEKDRSKIENDLFMPVLRFFTEDCYYTFNRIHNHATWAVAAVGLTGYVLNKPQYVEMALKGSKKDGRSGYLAQVEQLFSPDGYYMEGPYYQRYALLPFVLFAKAINNYQPELKIFEYRDRLLAKAIHTSLQETYTDGRFFPVNDAIKDKSYESEELVYGVDIAYADIEADADLLDVAQRQNRVIVSDAGLEVARAVAEGKAVPFKYIPLWLRDGNDGKKGGMGILRQGPNSDQQCLVLKATTQGMSHGHFDRLNMLFYDNNGEVFCDYGAARFLNIESKHGGHYLPENLSWAKQTIAHNTLVADSASHFKASLPAAEKFHPELLYFSGEPALQVVSAREDNAYPGISLIRTLALAELPGLDRPLLLDIFKVGSEKPHQYDLPFWYKGHIIDASFTIHAFTNSLKPLGTGNGYQHIWLNAENQLEANGGYITLLANQRFYTTHFTATDPLRVKLVSIGANDPEMNLLPGKAFMLSQPKAGDQTFVNITEIHGKVDPVNETITDPESSVDAVKLVRSDAGGTLVSFRVKKKTYLLQINYQDKKNFITLRPDGTQK